MFNKKSFQIIVALWAIWHAVFGLLATFAPETGARLTGWSPAAGWDSDILAMSTQYGMSMLLLALLFVFMTLNPLRYIEMIWVIIAEQVLGIFYALYIYTNIGTVTMTQISIQGIINLLIIFVFLTFWKNLHVPQQA